LLRPRLAEALESLRDSGDRLLALLLRGQVMKKFLAPLLAAVAALALAPAARAEVEKVELDVAGYLCGL